jgi:hypothetical protein
VGAALETQRSVYTLGAAARTGLTMRTDEEGGVHFEITASTDSAARAWVVRLHLGVGQRAVAATVDGTEVRAKNAFFWAILY